MIAANERLEDMQMKKRVAAWLLALVMLLALVGCGNDFNTATIITGESQAQDLMHLP